MYEYSYINDFYEEGNYYTVTGFNASFGGDNVNLEADVITEFIADDTVIVQAAPNLGQWGINWGEHFPNVINVGAWNTDQSGGALIGDYDDLATVDVYANGYVTKPGWGDDFGTSYASPRVFAEIINAGFELLGSTIEDSEELPENTNLTNEQYTQVMDFFVDYISRPVEEVGGVNDYYGPISASMTLFLTMAFNLLLLITMIQELNT